MHTCIMYVYALCVCVLLRYLQNFPFSQVVFNLFLLLMTTLLQMDLDTLVELLTQTHATASLCQDNRQTPTLRVDKYGSFRRSMMTMMMTMIPPFDKALT